MTCFTLRSSPPIIPRRLSMVLPSVMLRRLTLAPRLLPPYALSSFFSSLKKRQSVLRARIFCGLVLSSPVSWSRSA